MLTRRIFQELTDSFLLGRPIWKPCPHGRIGRPLQSIGPYLVVQYRKASSSSSSTRWKARQSRDNFSREAKVQGLKSRAAFKLLEINEKYKLFKPGQTVVDLGFAPGSWSQVAIDRTSPSGRVVGIDVIPAQPPKGVSTIQGNFLSPAVQAEVRAYVQDHDRGRPRRKIHLSAQNDASSESSSPTLSSPSSPSSEDESAPSSSSSSSSSPQPNVSQADLEDGNRGYLELERSASLDSHTDDDIDDAATEVKDRSPGLTAQAGRVGVRERDLQAGRVVDVVLSDMSAPWEQTSGFWKNSVSDPYHRMMNTSGVAFRDHAGSMDLCQAALTFCFDTLRTGGHFVCKFYQGAEDKAFELQLKRLFEKVHREKPESSRSESKETFFVALRRKEATARDDVFK